MGKNNGFKVERLPLTSIEARPTEFQKRLTPFSALTVDAIVRAGIDLSKFDPIPITRFKGEWVIAGDGHSRFEAIKRLAQVNRLPASWKVGRGKYCIPVREVDAFEAQRLSWTANLSRDGFTPAEEAGVYRAMQEAGMCIDDIAAMANGSAVHVQKMLSLNVLCRDIRMMVGASPAAGGIDIFTGQVLANGFFRFGIAPAQQQQLWHCVLKSAMLNFQSAKRFIDRIGSRLAEKSSDGFLFEMPANAVAVVAEAKSRGVAARTAKTGLGLLMSAHEAGALFDFPQLALLLEQHGREWIKILAERVTEDAEVLADLVAPPKAWKARPATEADRRIAAQYDPAATPLLIAYNT